ncbi:MAG: DUF5106 domain-containing protein [Prevotella sp.]|nr:DUF5106 domain-containing protein [Prevotella sp.]
MSRIIMSIATWAACALTTTAQHYAMPDVPDSLTTTSDRAGYALRHFWQRYDFSDTTLLRQDYAEQAMVEFLSLMPYATANDRDAGIRLWLKQADRDTTVCRYFLRQAASYLYQAQSPLRDEQTLQTILQHSLKLRSADGAMREKARFMLRLTSLNAVGSKAAAFNCETADGRQLNTDSIEGPMLLFCYDPCCESCQNQMFRLKYCSPLNLAINEGRLTMLAVYTGDDEALWRQTAANMPQQWTIAIDRTGIGDNLLYDLTEMPVMVLTDSRRTVLLKHPTIDQLTDWLMHCL